MRHCLFEVTQLSSFFKGFDANYIFPFFFHKLSENARKNLHFALLSALAVSVGLSGAATPSFALQLNASTPTLSVSATTIAFGNVNVGQTGTQVVLLSSTGTAPVMVSSISVAGSLFGASGVTTPVTLNPGQTVKLTASFSPPGAYSP